MTSETETERLNRGRGVALWAGVIGAPLVWATQVELIYAFSPWACTGARHLLIHVVTAIAIVLALVGAYLSRRDWKAAGGSPEETDGGVIPRIRFLGALGLFVSLVAAVLIFAQGMASLFFDWCWT
jgi:hypothetical protein